MIILNKKGKKATVYDIAKVANVSVSTVSKILNNTEHKFREETRELVFKIAQELGYEKQDNNYRNDNQPISNKVAVIIPDIINPYYASLANGLEKSLLSSDMNIHFHISHNNKELEVEITNQLINSDCLGVIIISICDDSEHIRKLIDTGIKVVAFEQSVDLDCNKVGFNYEKGGFMATEFLIENGFKEIGFISSPLTRSSRIQVFDGYKRALSKYNISYNEEIIKFAIVDNKIDNIDDYANGIEQVGKMISDNNLPKSIFCINDMTAVGVIRKLQDEGYNIPKDVSVIGFDNIRLSQIVRPELTTIEQSTYELGAVAAETLIGSLNDSNRGQVSIVLEPKLIIRESVLLNK